jgi:LysR family transcriptional regulator, regulator for bpeEF and oprC
LEEHFGVRLLHRTTRRVTPTEDGRDLLVHAHHVLDSVDTAETMVGKRRDEPSGIVHVGTTTAFGLFVAPRLALLFDRYPGLVVDLTVRDSPFDLVEEGLDLVVRNAGGSDSSLVSRRLSPAARWVVASPDYLARRGEPGHPSDLSEHDCIIYNHGMQVHEWRFDLPDGPLLVPVSGSMRSNSSAVVNRAVRGGIGIALLPRGIVHDDVAAGLLRVVLSTFSPESLPSEIVYPSRRLLPPRTRVVIDFLADQFRRSMSSRHNDA